MQAQTPSNARAAAVLFQVRRRRRNRRGEVRDKRCHLFLCLVMWIGYCAHRRLDRRAVVTPPSSPSSFRGSSRVDDDDAVAALTPHLSLGIGPAGRYGNRTDLSVKSYWETRLFFAVHDDRDDDENNSDRVRSALTLESPAVSKAMFPNDEVLNFERIDAEERTDDYVVLTGCPDGETIGFKYRGAGVLNASLELKTRRRCVDDDGVDDGGGLCLWDKTTKTLARNTASPLLSAGDPMADRQILLDFLADCREPQGEVVATWLKNSTRPLQIVRSKKRRKFALIDDSINVQEADIEFRLIGNGTVSTDQALVLRSWSAEAVNETSKLRGIAVAWEDHFSSAVTASGLDSAPAMWVASFPGMIQRVPLLLKELYQPL